MIFVAGAANCAPQPKRAYDISSPGSTRSHNDEWGGEVPKGVKDLNDLARGALQGEVV